GRGLHRSTCGCRSRSGQGSRQRLRLPSPSPSAAPGPSDSPTAPGETEEQQAVPSLASDFARQGRQGCVVPALILEAVLEDQNADLMASVSPTERRPGLRQPGISQWLPRRFLREVPTFVWRRLPMPGRQHPEVVILREFRETGLGAL